jgi:hypothetical protein
MFNPTAQIPRKIKTAISTLSVIENDIFSALG